MTNLTGSEKQINWANDIISDAIGTIDANIARWEQQSANGIHVFDKQIVAAKTLRVQVVTCIENTKTAKAIIDNRDKLDGSYIMQTVNKMASK